MATDYEAKAIKVAAHLTKAFPTLTFRVRFDSADYVGTLQDDPNYAGSFAVEVVGAAGSFDEILDARLTLNEVLKELRSYAGDLEFDSAAKK